LVCKENIAAYVRTNLPHSGNTSVTLAGYSYLSIAILANNGFSRLSGSVSTVYIVD
jgi:hypothetical protein